MKDEIPPWSLSRSREERNGERAERRRERHDRRDGRTDRNPRVPVAPGQIVDAALRSMDAEGLEALTVRRLAAELGSGVMTLYWHIENKDELLDLVIDRVYAEVPTPAEGATWREQARSMALTMRAAFLHHPACMGPATTRPHMGPNALRLMDAALGIFRSAGMPEQDVADAYFTLTNYVTGFCAWQVTNRLDAPTRASLIDYLAQVPADRFPHLQALGARVFSGNLDERFAFGLDTLLDGLARRAVSPTA